MHVVYVPFPQQRNGLGSSRGSRSFAARKTNSAIGESATTSVLSPSTVVPVHCETSHSMREHSRASRQYRACVEENLLEQAMSV